MQVIDQIFGYIRDGFPDYADDAAKQKVSGMLNFEQILPGNFTDSFDSLLNGLQHLRDAQPSG
jgi:hypothetical protein